MKTCPECQNEQPDSNFYFSQKSGLSSYCKICSKKRSKLWAKENPEQVKKLAIQYRQAFAPLKHCKICNVTLAKETKKYYCDRCREQARILSRRKERHSFKQRRPEDYKARRKLEVEKRTERNLQFIREYKTTHPCICGESHWAALDIHHIDPNKKNGKRMSKQTKTKIERELTSCIVLCANCHRKGHAGIPRPEHKKYFPP